jgi:hypothetical protein
MEHEDVGAEGSAGQECPADADFSGAAEEQRSGCEKRDAAASAVMTAEERAAIQRFLEEPGTPGARVGRDPSFRRAALKFAGMLLLAAGVGIGYADGNEFDEAGCTVAYR